MDMLQYNTKHLKTHNLFNKATSKYIEITSWKARAYGIFARVGDVSEIKRVSAANE